MLRKGGNASVSARLLLTNQNTAGKADPDMRRNFVFPAAYAIVQPSRITTAPQYPVQRQAALNADQAHGKPPGSTVDSKPRLVRRFHLIVPRLGGSAPGRGPGNRAEWQ